MESEEKGKSKNTDPTPLSFSMDEMKDAYKRGSDAKEMMLQYKNIAKKHT